MNDAVTELETAVCVRGDGLVVGDEEDRHAVLLAQTVDAFVSAGYRQIGMDHFALHHDSLAVARRQGRLHRNFQGYTTQAGASLYSFGISSISSTPDSYRQNHKTLEAWRASLDAGQLPTERGLRLTAEDRRRRTIIMRLMCDLSLDYDALGRRLGINFREYFAPEIATLGGEPSADGLVDLSDRGARVTDRGRLLLRNLAMLFDTYLDRKPKRYSPTV